MRPRLIDLAALAVLAGPVAVALSSGGYFEVVRLRAALAAVALVLVAAVLAPSPLPRSGPGRAAVAGLAGLAGLTAASIAWAPVGGLAGRDLQRLLLYLAALVAAAALLREPRIARATVPAVLAGIVVTIGYGLSERLLPGVISLADSASSGDRLTQPLTYWNATGALAGVGVVLAAGLAADLTRAAAVRAAAAACAPALGLAVYLTFSRGAIAATIAGVALLVALAADRASVRAVGIAVATTGPAVLATLVLPDVSSAVPVGTAQGLVMLAGLALLSAVAGSLTLLGARRNAAWSSRTTARRLPIARSAALGVIALAVAFAIAGALGGQGAERSARLETRASPARLASVQSNRYAYWRVAVGAFAGAPLAGVGSGGFRTEWLRERPFAEGARDAHSLYLETAAELGLLGLLALTLLVGGVAVAARRAPGSTAASAALATYAVHAGLDWDWEVPGLTLFALVLAGSVIALSESPESAAA